MARLINADALHKRLDALFEDIEGDKRLSRSERSCMSGAVDECIDLLESTPLEKPQKWVSVKDRLPEPEETVLVCAEAKENRGHRVCAVTQMVERDVFGQLVKRWRSPWNGFREMYEITHWMPLPEPPEEDESHDGT